MQVTYHGHSCFSVVTNGKNILFDPFITPNPLVQDKNISNIMPDYICVSHGHEDHIADLLTVAKQSQAMCIINWEIHNWLQKNGISHVHPMNSGGSKAFDFGSIQCTEAIHSSSFADGSYAGNCNGFIIKNTTDCFYYSGDTALFLNMQLFPIRNKIKCAFLPIGGNFTMDYIDAIQAAKFLQCNYVIGMHYDTFGFIQINKNECTEAFAKENITLKLMEINQTITVN